MKLWILRPLAHAPWEPWYDKAFGFVVRAETESAAREYASREPGDEGGQVWRDTTMSTCEELAAEGEAGVIMQDFHAA